MKWHVSAFDSRIIEDDDGFVVADLRQWQHGEPELIAAAPEMREALLVAAEVLEYVASDEETKAAGLWQGAMIPRVLEIVKAALPKTGGK
jgi:hypothetical protein